jgi:hypothetical protein
MSSVQWNAFRHLGLAMHKYATNHTLLSQETSLQLSNNLYYTISSQGPAWVWNGTTYTSFSAFQAATGEDSGSMYANPMLNSVYREFPPILA